MFAVPGWSVSADALKVQVDPKAAKPANDSKPAETNGTDKKSRKRKRGHGSSKGVEVTEENLGDLWREHIEKESLDHAVGEPGRETLKQKKKRKREREGALDESMEVSGGTFESFSEGNGTSGLKEEGAPAKKKKQKQEKEKENSSPVVQTNGQENIAEDLCTPAKDPHDLESGKAKYEQRKAEAAKRHEQRALFQANGTLPPTRPEPTTNTSTKTTISTSKKPSKALEPSVTLDAHQGLHPIKSITPPIIKPKDHSKPPTPPNVSKPSAPPLPTTNLTPLQQRMAAKLTSARFRHLNQTLYTSPSDEAMRLFTDSPQAYTSYHAGFRAQVAVWPQNPVEGFIENVKTRGRISVPSQKKMWREMKKGKKEREQPDEGPATNGDAIGRLEPLPRTKGTCTIADLGCGDAHLAASLDSLRKSLNLNLLSFDLAKGDTPNAKLITVADTSNLSSVGIRDGSVDIAICCLSLMGTNWVTVVDECSRIVRGGGEVWVAEIKSRFARPGQAKKKGDGIGKKKKQKKDAADDEDNEEAVALEEVEDGKGPKYETDVSAFVEVFRKRGFNLKGEPDMDNKIFVWMRFVKALRSENEKGGAAKFGDGFRGKQAKTKFLEDEGVEVDESKVLKPCVYKIR
ncbi:hypothetical protein OEA41_003300 [Lepraria neglecta]|uniref:Ribosomal RNA-processing protein 8 n=1 Tax=Lepraria neglecta TaxID=209136 RepID=A0AAD9Z5H8_9LECA|nr:hypothetical protein OEA41_003300 [Lepraria neglecta]